MVRIPVFFDASTAAALSLFEGASVDRVLLEVGMGGRLDSTNIVQPKVTCIASIELEHTDVLGDRIEDIAFEKAGILKPGVPCVMGPLPDQARDIVRDRAKKVGAPLREFGVDFTVEMEPRATNRSEGPVPLAFRYCERDGFEIDTRLAVLGEHQVLNASLAIAAVRCLEVHSDDALKVAVASGLPRVELPGRLEILGRKPWIVVDEAHTAASADVLARLLTAFEASERHLILSISRGKNYDAILDSLLPVFERVTVTRSERHRSVDPDELASWIRARGYAHVEIFPEPRRAIRQARQQLDARGLLCAAGSVYLAGIAREELQSRVS